MSTDPCIILPPSGTTQLGSAVEMSVRTVTADERPAPAAPQATRVLHLNSGRKASFQSEGDDILLVTSPSGRVELSVRFTEHGPVLSFDAAGLYLKTAGELSMECRSLKVSAEDSMELSAGGDALVEGYSVGIRSERGNIDLKANDDVRLLGERIKLNC